jgi:Ca2+-binding EF-hand superfamily protein
MGEMREKALEKFDANGDGELDENERAAAKEAFKERKGEMREKALEKFDADGDGKLNEAEREKARDAWKKHKRHGPKPVNENF